MTDEKLKELKQRRLEAELRAFDLSCRIRPRDSGYDEDIDESIPPYPEGHNPEDDFLISVYEEGVAEGAAAERAAMRAYSGFLHKGSYASSDNCFDDVLQRESGEFATVAVCDCYVTPASLLVPKEGEK